MMFVGKQCVECCAIRCVVEEEAYCDGANEYGVSSQQGEKKMSSVVGFSSSPLSKGLPSASASQQPINQILPTPAI